jgi:ferritin-like metal-binding protein YciE
LPFIGKLVSLTNNFPISRGIVFEIFKKNNYMEQLLTLRELLQHEIDDLYSAEEQIIEALPKMVEAATSPELKSAFKNHLIVTRKQKNRLDQIRKILENGPKAEPGLVEKIFGSNTKCKGTEGLIKEAEHIMKQTAEDSSVKDAAIIAAAQKIEHYEISGYGTARAFAMQLRLSEVEQLLAETLNEEHDADNELNGLALFGVNVEASQENGVPK